MNNNKTKICKHCKEQIAKNAKRCPKCGGKLGLPAIVKILIFLIIFFIIVISMVSSCANEVSNSIDETENSYLDVNGKTIFSVNDTFENKYLKITMTEINANFKDYSEYLGPKSGYKVVMAKFEVENIGTEDQYVSTYEFNCYADGVAMEDFLYVDDNYEWLSATLSSGKRAFGYVFFEVPENSNEIILEYNTSWLDNNNITFVIK